MWECKGNQSWSVSKRRHNEWTQRTMEEWRMELCQVCCFTIKKKMIKMKLLNCQYQANEVSQQFASIFNSGKFTHWLDADQLNHSWLIDFVLILGLHRYQTSVWAQINIQLIWQAVVCFPVNPTAATCSSLFSQKLDSPVNMQLSLVQWWQVGNRIHANYITAANPLTFAVGSG